MTAPEFYTGMRKHFGIGQAGPFLDATLALYRREPKLDVIVLDDWLHAKHGEYENDGLSMAECIAKYYGEPAKNFVQSLL